MDILSELQEYAPSVHYDDGSIEAHIFKKILLGGDQLTVKRARGAQMLKSCEIGAGRQLRGLLPSPEDWHARQVVVQVKQT